MSTSARYRPFGHQFPASFKLRVNPSAGTGRARPLRKIGETTGMPPPNRQRDYLPAELRIAQVGKKPARSRQGPYRPGALKRCPSHPHAPSSVAGNLPSKSIAYKSTEYLPVVPVLPAILDIGDVGFICVPVLSILLRRGFQSACWRLVESSDL